MIRTHPGQVLKEEHDTIGNSLSEFARQIDVPANRNQPDENLDQRVFTVGTIGVQCRRVL